MSCRGAIYTVNSNVSVAANGNIPLGSVVRRVGDAFDLQGSTVICCGCGYYMVDVSVTLIPVAAGEVGVQLYADGVEVPGAVAYTTAEAGDAACLSFPAIVRRGCRGAVSIGLGLISDAATTGVTVDNVAVVVEAM